MKLKLCFLFVVLYGRAYAQFSDNFSDADLKNRWSGLLTEWRVSNETLNTSNTKASKSFLTRPNKVVLDTQWEFWINLQFNPSGSNYVDVFLASDSSNLLATGLQGYFVRLGSSKDDICLYRKQNGKNTLLIDGKDGLLNKSNNLLKVKVNHSADGNFTLFTDLTATGNSYQTQGIKLDTLLKTSSFFGVLAVYTGSASFLNKHFFDDIVVGKIVHDTTAPVLVLAEPVSANAIRVNFNERVEMLSAAETFNYYIADMGFPVTASLDTVTGKSVVLTFEKSFVSKTTYKLQCQKVKDEASNFMKSESFAFLYYVPSYGDIIINEIMADPTPTVVLPDEEYLELYNTTEVAISLDGWRIKKGSTFYTLKNRLIPAGGYLTLCRSLSETAFSGYGAVMGLESFPSLTNGGDQLALLSGSLVVDYVTYADSWYSSSVKKEGGWSLERVNPKRKCSDAANWKASESSNGGTPSIRNSVYDISEDFSGPEIVKYWPLGDTALVISFNEILSGITVVQGVDCVLGINKIKTDSLNPNQLIIGFNRKMETGTRYSIKSLPVKDCEGNTSTVAVEWLLPQQGAIGDIVINEVLFNPRAGGVDFVELFNRSDKYIDVSQWSIANVQSEIVANKKAIGVVPNVLPPGQYVYLTENPDRIKQDYPAAYSNAAVKISSMPSYNDDKGTVILCTPEGSIGDRFDYQENFHFQLIDNKEGVSLERIDAGVSTVLKDNWHSAASDAGYATPGYINSQARRSSAGGDDILIEPQVFSPDEDGRDDFTLISYKYQSKGKVHNVHIYDASGRLVKVLGQNNLAGLEGFLQWDGTTDSGQKAHTGPYVLHVDVYDLEGSLKTYRKRVVLAFCK